MTNTRTANRTTAITSDAMIVSGNGPRSVSRMVLSGFHLWHANARANRRPRSEFANLRIGDILHDAQLQTECEKWLVSDVGHSHSFNTLLNQIRYKFMAHFVPQKYQ